MSSKDLTHNLQMDGFLQIQFMLQASMVHLAQKIVLARFFYSPFAKICDYKAK